ncbi:N-carbamoylsarcosine amidase [Phytohabitans suffuscus]|uniref:N-carbamoylsarcosine amidase n=1 Tax=Phytohabitans suffuscus TaxID=624315 RepID=A0A6F8YW82_9ACTN|nr:isochorismatase family protein [Phytohabitans suffuscus]BCB90111.1 N-carbamoylsarcosine amidase [Phytohabitans suffuscus]
MRWWQDVFAGEAGTAYASFAHRQEPGTTPAVLVIDVVRSFVGSPGLDLAAAVAEWPTACGPAAYEALPALARLLAAARGAGVPVVHLRPAGPAARFLGPTVKNELVGEFVNGRPGAVDFVPESTPRDGELVVAKSRASAFFNTPVATYLHALGVDDLFVAGTTTSGCVRASVVDAFSHGFKPFVVEQAVFDRSRLSAAVSLYEMDAKYADVVQLDDAVKRLDVR